MTEIQKRLFEHSEEKFADFQSKLTPGVPREKFIGVRTPVLRALAKELKDSELSENFLHSLPHEYFEENQLHGFLLSLKKDFNEVLALLDDFLPYVDNWATSDQMSPKVFKKHTEELLPEIDGWIASGKTYSMRFGLSCLMEFYLDEKFDESILEKAASVKSEEYYVNMMIAWLFATALAKQWDSAIKVIESGNLEKWVHNKTIQKAIESYRITPEQKEYLRTLKKK